jgi:hypothetical protein
MQPTVAQSVSAVYFKLLFAAARLGCLGRFRKRPTSGTPDRLPIDCIHHRRRRDAAPSSPIGPRYQSPSRMPPCPLACFPSVHSSLAVVSGVAAVPRAPWRIYETISDFRLPITPSVGTTTRAACTLPGTGLSRQLCFFRSCIAPWSSCAKIDAASCWLPVTPTRRVCRILPARGRRRVDRDSTLAKACRNGCGVGCGWWPSGGVPRLWLPCRTPRPTPAKRIPDAGSRGNGTLKFRRKSDQTFRH